MSNTQNNPPIPSAKGRGRGYGIDNSPLKKPDSSRNASRPGSAPQSPRRNTSTSSQNLASNTLSDGPRTTVSDSSVGTSRKTSLDVLAPEFVPTFTKSAKSLPALSVEAPTFVPSSPKHMSRPPLEIQKYDQLVSHIEVYLNEFLDRPSRYDHRISQVIEHLGLALSDSMAMEIICDVIFEWAVSATNFAYICARLCEDVARNVTNNYNGRFHQHMLKRCHREHKNLKDLLLNNPSRTSSFAVFLAELYSREEFRIRPLMEAVLKVVELMVQNLDDMFARPVGQVLKMCGACLEDQLALTEDTARMNSLMSSITNKVSGGVDMSRSMSGLLKSVLTLRAANWGRVTSPSPSPVTPPSLNTFTQEPVFYNTTGQRITREDAGYGEDNPCWDERSIDEAQPANGDVISGAAGDFSESEEQNINADGEDLDLDILVIDDDEQMTEEMWAAFERFEAERDHLLSNYDGDGES